MILDAGKIDVGPDRRRGAALHVCNSATVDLAIDELAPPRVFGPSKAVVGDGKHVDVTVEHEMLTGAAGLEGGDYVRHLRVWRDNAIVEAPLLELAGYEVCRGARIARRVRTSAPHESPQECDQCFAIFLDPRHKLLAII